MLLHGVVKSTEKLPESDIQKAEERIAVHAQRWREGDSNGDKMESLLRATTGRP
jgi:hypothetical protein